jgi:4-amino-4-deoxy-L-arabinose transferase-like glycosyltransferase
MERRVFFGLLALIIVLGAYLRLADLGGPSLWLDEMLHLEVTQSLSDQPWYRLLAGVREIAGKTENGALYYGLQILGQRLAPGETGVRLLPAIIGILTLPLMALTGRLLGGRLVALAATFLLAVSPLHVYYSREGRPYSLTMALALLLLFALLQKGSRAGIWIAYVGCLLAAYVGITTIPVLLSFSALSTVGLWWSLRDGLKPLRSPYVHYLMAAILSLGLSYGLYATSYGLFIARTKIDIPVLEEVQEQGEVQRFFAHESPLSTRNLKRFLASMTTSGHQSVTITARSWVLLVLSAVGLAFGGRRRPREIVATAGMCLLPAALTIAALVSLERWYAFHYTSSSLPAFLLLVALGVTAAGHLVGRALGNQMGETKRKVVTWVSVGVILLLFVAPNLTAARVDPHRKLDWRGVAQFFDAVALEGEPVLVPNLWPQICLDYYLQDLGRDVEFVNLWESSTLAERALAERPKGWMLTAGFQKSNEVRAWMHRFVPVLKKSEEEMALFFFPDFVTLLETRFAAQKGAVFEKQFAMLGQRFEFGGAELALQGRGWSYPERNNAGIEYQWALGEQAELGLPIGRPRDARIRLRVLPFTYPEAPVQTLEMWLNEAPLATLELSQSWSEHEVAVPASSWSSGANILYLRFGRSTSPAQVDSASQDHRNLSAAFDFLEVVTEDPGAAD